MKEEKVIRKYLKGLKELKKDYKKRGIKEDYLGMQISSMEWVLK